MLDFSFSHKTPVVLQTEAAECGLACLAMVATFHGHRVDLATLRARHGVSLRGSSLTDLMRLAAKLNFFARPLRLELENIAELRLPCVLHWDFSHFVVLTQVRPESVVVHDPNMGQRRLSLKEFSKHFTGVALELTPTHEFSPRVEKARLSLAALIGRMSGLGKSVTYALLLALSLQLFAILAPFYMQWIVDQALVSQDKDLVTVLATGFLLLAVVHAGVAALRAWVLMVLGTRLNLQLVSNLFSHLIRLPMSWFEKRHMGDIVSRFESLNVIQRTLTTGFLEALIDGVMVLLTLAMMLFYSVKLAAIAMLAATLYAGLRFTLYRPWRMATEEHIVRSAKQQSHFIETVRGMQSIKLFGHETQRRAAWQNLVVDAFNAGIRTQRLGILYQGMNGLLFGVENVITIWLGALLILEPTPGAGFSIGMLFAFIAYKTQFVQRTAALVEKGLELKMLGLHSERVGDVALVVPEPTEEFNQNNTQTIVGAVELKNVSFSHAPSDPCVISNVSFSIAAGESIAIVGPSGCGKTTLVKLILGLLKPTEGSIEIDGVALDRLGQAHFRQGVASVMQEDQLFAGSIAENICFFEPSPDFDRIESSAALAAIHEDIVAMPMQYNTLVGDMGTVLSGGQKQRVLLARALYRQPRILVLDEATSHLDLAHEAKVNSAVRSLALTRIIVAHRPETIASADRVVTLGEGKVLSDTAVAHSRRTSDRGGSLHTLGQMGAQSGS